MFLTLALAKAACRVPGLGLAFTLARPEPLAFPDWSFTLCTADALPLAAASLASVAAAVSADAESFTLSAFLFLLVPAATAAEDFGCCGSAEGLDSSAVSSASVLMGISAFASLCRLEAAGSATAGTVTCPGA